MQGDALNINASALENACVAGVADVFEEQISLHGCALRALMKGGFTSQRRSAYSTLLHQARSLLASPLLHPFLPFPAGNAQGVSLVHHLRMSQRLQQQQQAEVRNSKGTNASEQASPAEEHPLFPIIRHLRDRIDAEVPGMYAWMNDDSLHCTFRALM